MNRFERLQQLLAKSPDDPFLHFGMAMEHAKAGAVADALAGFDRALGFDASYTAAHFQKATLLISIGRQRDARSVLESGMLAAQKAGDQHTLDEMRTLLESISA